MIRRKRDKQEKKHFIYRDSVANFNNMTFPSSVPNATRLSLTTSIPLYATGTQQSRRPDFNKHIHSFFKVKPVTDFSTVPSGQNSSGIEKKSFGVIICVWSSEKVMEVILSA